MKGFDVLIPIERKAEIQNACAAQNLKIEFLSENRFNAHVNITHKNPNQKMSFQMIFDLGRLFETILNQE